MSIADRPGLAVGFVGGMLLQKMDIHLISVMDFANSNPVSSGFLGALLAGFVAGYLVLLLKEDILINCQQSLRRYKTSFTLSSVWNITNGNIYDGC